ncbi:S1 family peptidase [Streptomyces liangshanensis]|uniref:S1 family peptidase n=1 Tax=Streptomyces liangshanensis TaxID=2717324 RepID=UPI0036DD802A
MNSKIARRIRVIAVASGLLAATALATPAAAGGTAADHGTLSAAEFAAADASLRAADVAGSAWHADTEAGKVRVTVDSTVDAAEVAKLRKAVPVPADALEITRTPGRFTPLIAGGEAITGGGTLCSLGFNVQSGTGVKYALTAGHCTSGTATWSIGPRAGSSFPGNDYGLIRHTNPAAADGRVYLHNGTYQDITTAGNAVVGLPVCFSGATSGVHCGTVTALNATVNYGSGNLVSGLGRTNICAAPGDSGGSVFQGGTAIGLISGGSGTCATGGVTYYQPVLEALNAYGVSVF